MGVVDGFPVAGLTVGSETIGCLVGVVDGELETGVCEGFAVGVVDGFPVGLSDGVVVGLPLGLSVGFAVGF